MNRLAVITAFLGGVKNRYITYKPERTLQEKFAVAAQIERLDGLELCYPADFGDLSLLRSLLDDYGFGVSSVNVRSRRTGKWLRGSFTSPHAAERAEVVDDFKRAMDLAQKVGSSRISTCPLNDGHDYVFEINYLDAYRFAEETFDAICAHNRDVRVSIEFKWNDPRVRCLLASAGETLAFCQSVGAENLGVTMDIGHALLSGERPAQSVALLARANKLFYVHLNDNDRNWDWDMLPGAYNTWEFVEFFYYLREVGYTDDWYAYDVMSKEFDAVETFSTVTYLTRRLEEMAGRIDREQMAGILAEQNPNRSLRYLYERVIGDWGIGELGIARLSLALKGSSEYDCGDKGSFLSPFVVVFDRALQRIGKSTNLFAGRWIRPCIGHANKGDKWTFALGGGSALRLG